MAYRIALPPESKPNEDYIGPSYPKKTGDTGDTGDKMGGDARTSSNHAGSGHQYGHQFEPRTGDQSGDQTGEGVPIEEGTIQGIKIASTVLGDDIWLILDRSFIPTDGLACYYPEEIPLLRDKTPEELREIHKVKLAFPGARVIQEGPHE
jgi:hypothetical protein